MERLGDYGGLVTPSGIQYLGMGGNVLPFRPRGTDTVPAMLTPGELVLTRREAQAYLAGGGTQVDISPLQDELRSLRADSARRDLDQPYRIARAVRDELQKVSR